VRPVFAKLLIPKELALMELIGDAKDNLKRWWP